MAYKIDIDSFIGDYGYSNRYVKSILSENQGAPLSVRINSYGGDVNQALDISAQFEAHGNITVDFFAFNASSATVLSLGAKNIRMHIDGFYLIHKAMSWVDNWGFMNPDELEELIKELEKDKKENEKVTLVLARRYADKTGKSITDILNLMKEQTWLTAQESKEWGFVDEIFGTATKQGKMNFSDEMKTKFNAIGLPIPERFSEAKSNTDTSLIADFFDSIKKEWAELKNSFRPVEINKPKIPTSMNNKFTHINTVLSVEGIEEAEGKVSLSVADLEKVNTAIANAEAATALEKKNVSEKDTKISELEAQITALKNKAGASTDSLKKPADGNTAEINDEFTAMQNMKNLCDVIGFK